MKNDVDDAQYKHDYKDNKADLGVNGCPNCGSNNYIPIVYGFPTSEAFQKSKRGELILAGCCIFEPNPPLKCCKRCSSRYN